MIKKIKSHIVFWYNSLYNSIYFWHMKKKAINLHKLTGKQYHIIPSGLRRLIIVDNTSINEINKNLPKKKKITAIDLYNGSYFSTSSKSPFKK